jgi:hypothetical protein
MSMIAADVLAVEQWLEDQLNLENHVRSEQRQEYRLFQDRMNDI